MGSAESIVISYSTQKTYAVAGYVAQKPDYLK